MLDFLSAPLAPVCPQNIFKELPNFQQREIEETYEEIYELYKAGQLFSEDDYEQFRDMMVSSPIKAMCLHIAHDCNLRCKYCFASTGDFGAGRRLMPLEVGKKAIDFLIANSGERHNLELDFLAANH